MRKYILPLIEVLTPRPAGRLFLRRRYHCRFRFLSALKFSFAATAFFGSMACWAETLSSAYVFKDMADMDRIVAVAQAGTDPDIRASGPDKSGYPRQTPLVLVRIKGRPAISYTRGVSGNNGIQTNFSMSCRGMGVLDITEVLFSAELGRGSLSDKGQYAISLGVYGVEAEHELPVTLLKQFMEDSRLFVRVHGTADASDPFFASLRATPNFFAQLKQDGRFRDPDMGIDLTDFDTKLKPLIDYCASTAPDAPAPPFNRPRHSNDLVSDSNPDIESSRNEVVSYLLGPSANQIRGALQRKVDANLAGLDAMADQCKTFRQQNNPLGAMMCLMSGGGAMTSKTVKVSVNSVSLNRCVISTDKVAYCRYRPDVKMQGGSGMMGQIASIFNAGQGLGGWSYSSFSISNGSWEWVKTFESCDFSSDRIHCRWREVR